MTQHPLRLMVVIALFLPLLYACASRSQSSYYASEVGQTMAIEDVRVISSRLVKIEGLDESGRPGWGTAVGPPWPVPRPMVLPKATTRRGSPLLSLPWLGVPLPASSWMRRSNRHWAWNIFCVSKTAIKLLSFRPSTVTKSAWLPAPMHR